MCVCLQKCLLRCVLRCGLVRHAASFVAVMTVVTVCSLQLVLHSLLSVCSARLSGVCSRTTETTATLAAETMSARGRHDALAADDRRLLRCKCSCDRAVDGETVKLVRYGVDLVEREPLVREA